MNLLSLIITIAVVGVALWAINSFIPMESRIKSILNVVVIVVLIIWLLQSFGVLGSLRSARIGCTTLEPAPTQQLQGVSNRGQGADHARA